jgi:hypothetical protein
MPTVVRDSNCCVSYRKSINISVQQKFYCVKEPTAKGFGFFKLIDNQAVQELWEGIMKSLYMDGP